MNFEQFQEIVTKSINPEYKTKFYKNEFTFYCYIYDEKRHKHCYSLSVSYRIYGTEEELKKWCVFFGGAGCAESDSLYGCFAEKRKYEMDEAEMRRKLYDSYCNHAEGKC